jgi:hypothetical protein
VPFGSIKGSSIAPLNVGAEREGFEGDAAYNEVNNRNEFGGRASGAKSASLPPDAQYAF